MSHELRHEVTMLVNGESRRVQVEPEKKPEPPAPPAKPATAKTPKAPKKETAAKPTLLERAKSAITGKGKKG